MSFGDAIRTGFSKYATFSGRARRSEYWFFYLFYVLVIVAASLIGRMIGFSLLGNLASLALIVPMLAAGVRRMHDTGRIGWLILVPIANIVWLASDTNAAGDKYGPSPKGAVGYPAYPQA